MTRKRSSAVKKRIGIGSVVEASAKAVLESDLYTILQDPQAHTLQLQGVVQRSVTVNNRKRWVIRWFHERLEDVPTKPMTTHSLTPIFTRVPLESSLRQRQEQRQEQPEPGPGREDVPCDDGDACDDVEDGIENDEHRDEGRGEVLLEPGHSQQGHPREEASQHDRHGGATPHPPNPPATTTVDGVTWTIQSAVMGELPRANGFVCGLPSWFLSKNEGHQYFRESTGDMLQLMLEGTNENLRQRKKRLLSFDEFMRVIGSLLACCCSGQSSLRRNWSAPARSFMTFSFEEAFGLSYTRVADVLASLACVPDSEDVVHHRRHDGFDEAREMAARVRPLVDEFNRVRKRHVPSKRLTIDESMSAFESKELLPMATIHTRKPKPQGFELKAIACVESGVLLKVEVQEGKRLMQEKDYAALGATGWVLRLGEQYFNTERLIIGDSAFASVQTAVEARKRGLHFLGNVKTATSRFPHTWLKQHVPSAIGSTITATATVDGHGLIAHAWRSGNIFTLISTAGNNAEVDDGEGRMSTLIRAYKAGANVVDVHNQIRQGTIALERAYKTKSWLRRVIATLVSMCATDAYLLWNRSNPQHIPVLDFIGELADVLGKTAPPPSPRTERRLSLRSASSVDDDEDHNPDKTAKTSHWSRNLRDHPHYNLSGETKVVRRRCSMCKVHKASYYCVQCSTPDRIVAICGPHRPLCMKQHIDRWDTSESP